MADQSVRGRFVWHELMTPDASAAHAFYSKAIGWKSQPWEEDSSYVMFAAARGPVGATVNSSDGTAPHWLPYIGTGDIEATIELAKQNGGSVVAEIDTLSSGSRYAVLQDPYGTAFGVYESAEEYGKFSAPQPGEHSWHELMSGDGAGAFEFYAELFGWDKVDEMDMGEMGKYLIYGFGDLPFGGIMTAPPGSPKTWLSYVHVKDVNQTAKKAKSAGAKIANGPMEVPGGDWIVQLIDPQGALFAAHASAANMKPKKSKPKLVAAESPPPVVEEPAETPAADEPPPADKAPAKKAPAKKAPPQEAPAEDTPAEPAPAKEAPAKKSPARKAPAKKAPAKKAPAKKSPAKKSPAKAPAKKKGGKKKAAKKSVAKGTGSKKTAAKKGAKKGAAKASKKVKTRSGGNNKAAKKPRKGK